MTSDFRKIIMTDDDGNLYLIPMSEERDFDDWVTRAIRGEHYKPDDYQKFSAYQIKITFVES